MYVKCHTQVLSCIICDGLKWFWQIIKMSWFCTLQFSSDRSIDRWLSGNCWFVLFDSFKKLFRVSRRVVSGGGREREREREGERESFNYIESSSLEIKGKLACDKVSWDTITHAVSLSTHPLTFDPQTAALKLTAAIHLLFTVLLDASSELMLFL